MAIEGRLESSTETEYFHKDELYLLNMKVRKDGCFPTLIENPVGRRIPHSCIGPRWVTSPETFPEMSCGQWL